jgi:hypothetical protein
MSGAIVTVYALMSSSVRTKEQTSIVAEAVFVNQKLAWVFTGASVVDVIDAETLTVVRPDLGTSSPLIVGVENNQWYLTRGLDSLKVLSGPQFKVANVVMTVAGRRIMVSYTINNELFMFTSNF